MKANVELHIDKLVLHGFERKDGFPIRDALTNELTRLFQDQGIPIGVRQEGAFGQINTNAFHFRAQDRPEQIGRAIAHSIYNSFSNNQ